MEFWIGLMNILEAKMKMPATYGWYHILWLCGTAGLTMLLCTRFRHCKNETVEKVVFWVAAVVALLEVYKQIVYTLRVVNGAVVADFQWYAFPWQFCSTPMYAGLLTGIFRKGKIHDALYAYLATFVVFAGLCVMIYPGDVYTDLVGINIQTMVCHSTMIILGVWLLASGYVPLGHRTVLKGCCVFSVAVAIAVVLNEGMWYSGILGDETFNMFFISRHFPGTLPVYSLVQQVVPYPWCLIIYVAAFTAAAFLVMGAAQLVCNRQKTRVGQT